MRWLHGMVLGSAVLVAGCGGSGEPGVVSESESRTFGNAERKAPAWAPAIEAVWKKAMESNLGPNHLLVVEHGVNGPQLYDAYLVFWGNEGPFRTVRAHLPLNDLDHPRWIEKEVPREQGQGLLDTLGELQVLRLTGDDSLSATVFGAGSVRFHVLIGSRENDFEVYAPYRLAKVSNKTRYREILFLVLEMVAEQQN